MKLYFNPTEKSLQVEDLFVENISSKLFLTNNFPTKQEINLYISNGVLPYTKRMNENLYEKLKEMKIFLVFYNSRCDEATER